MRTGAALLALLALAGCGEESQPPEGEVIECAIGAGADFSPECLYDYRAGAQEVVIWHPDGGFRRFNLLPGGAGVSSTDGAEQVIQGIMGGQLEVTVGQDRYRLPTTPVS
jgi:hypothetical protein